MYIAVFLILFVFSAFRYKIGCDWYGYAFQYERFEILALQFSQIREPIWWMSIGLVKFLDLPYPTLNVITSGIFFLGIHVLARRQPDPLAFIILLLPILIINLPMSGMRQGAAVGLICIALTAFMDRKPLAFMFWVVLASTFHVSAIIFIVISPLSFGGSKKKRILFQLSSLCASLPLIASSEAMGMALFRYVGTGAEAAGAAFRLLVLLLTAFYFLLFLRVKWKRISPSDYSIVTIGVAGMLFIMLLLPLSSVISDRLGYYLIPIQAMIFARIPFLPMKSLGELHRALPYVGLYLVFLVWSLMSKNFESCYLPYQSWLFGFPNDMPI